MIIRNDASSHYSFVLQDRRPMTEDRSTCADSYRGVNIKHASILL